MADTKITALTAITTVDPAADVLPIVDVSDTSMAASGTTKKITSNQILGAGGTATLASATISGAANFNGGALAAYLNGSLMFGSSGNTVNFFGQSSGFAFKESTGVNNLLTINTSGFVFGDGAGGTRMTLNATGLGVGEAASVSRLQPRGSTSDSSAYVIYAKNSGGNVINFMRNDGRFIVGNGTVDNFIVTETGNVGIGVSPSYKLDVNGVINTSSDIYALGGRFALYRSAGSSYIDWSSGQSLIFRTVTSAGGAGASTIATIDSSGNVGIGVTPSAKLDVAVTGAGTPRVRFTSDSDNPIVEWQRFQGTATNYYGYRIQGGFGALAFLNSNVAAIGSQTWTQAMTLDASGNLLVGKSVSLFSTVGVEASGTGFISATNSASTNATTNLSVYSTGAAAFRFYVGLGGTVYATNTTISAISDARLKENVQDIDVGLGAILALKPRKFDWKEGKGKDIKGDRGFIAQEFEQVFPQLVDEWKDAAPEGEAPYKSVRQDLIPVLVKAIQELTARVQTLETR